MPDRLTPSQRHDNMSRIRSRDTKPEKKVRQALFRAGFRYRNNVRTLPGTPDIVPPKYRTAIFVNGCFWHGHKGCPHYTVPETNTAFWVDKVRKNKERAAAPTAPSPVPNPAAKNSSAKKSNGSWKSNSTSPSKSG